MNEEFRKIDRAIECFNEASREELLSYLAGNDEVLMQISLLNLSDIYSQKEAESIVNTLTEHSSETREYSAFLINRLMNQKIYSKYFTGDVVLSKFSGAISDVNPKVCRKIIEILPYYCDLDRLFPLLLKNAMGFINGLQEKNKNKNYQYNTLSFRLYWTIFGMAYALNREFLDKYETELIILMQKLSEFKEYTIREKAAVLAQKINSIRKIPIIEKYLQEYSQDENFFVKEIVN